MQATFANGMHAVVVETDPDTAEIKVLRYCVVHDCGPLINPMIVEGQVHGGVAQGVGGALYERMDYDENGQLLNASFMDFLMPYASEVPTIEIDHLETPSPLNPLGIKGAGEAGVIPSAAVFASAIEDAEGFADHGGCRSRRASCSSCAAGTPPGSIRGAVQPPEQEEHRMKVTGSATLQRTARRGLGGAQRPRRPGPHHPRLPAARGGRPGRLPDDHHRRGRLDQGHLPGRRVAHRPGAARIVHAAGVRRGRARARCSADVKVSRSPTPTATTRLDYDADAVVGGMIGGVGQRVLSGVAKKTAGEFFQAVDDVLTGKAPQRRSPPRRDGHRPPWRRHRASSARPPPSGVRRGGSEFVKGAVFGAVVALAGVLVGGFVTRRRG